LVAWLFTMPHVWKMFLSVMINHCLRELWPITIEWDYWSWCSLWLCIFNTHIFPTHSLKYPWVYICLHTITRHKGSFNIHIFQSLNSTFGNNLITLVVHPMYNPYFILCKPQIMWYLSKSQSISILVYQINVESQINVLHIKSPFWCTSYLCRLLTYLQA
jgi:hypothetical protein